MSLSIHIGRYELVKGGKKKGFNTRSSNLYARRWREEYFTGVLSAG